MTVWTWPLRARALAFAAAILLWLLAWPWSVVAAPVALLLAWIAIDWRSARHMTAEDFRRRDAGDCGWTHCANCGLAEFPAHCHADANPWGARDQPCHPAWRKEG